MMLVYVGFCILSHCFEPSYPILLHHSTSSIADYSGRGRITFDVLSKTGGHPCDKTFVHP